MSIAKFEVSAYEGGDGGYRVHRLHTILGYVYGRLSAMGVATPIEEMNEVISGLHDHKGTLQVHWANQEAIQKYGPLFFDAWTQIGSEPMIEFYLPTGTIFPM